MLSACVVHKLKMDDSAAWPLFVPPPIVVIMGSSSEDELATVAPLTGIEHVRSVGDEANKWAGGDDGDDLVVARCCCDLGTLLLSRSMK